MNWKDSSDFASLAAAMKNLKDSKAKKDGKTDEKTDEKYSLEVTHTNSSIEPDSSIEPSIKKDTSIETDSSSLTIETDTSTFETNTITIETLTNFSLHTTLKGHKSAVSSITFDRSGARLISGSHDSTVAFWDFAGMTHDTPEPFRFIQPLGVNPIRAICPSVDGQWILLGAATVAAKLFDRNAGQIREYAKGDPYLRDLKHTIGHTAAITSACWAGNDSDRFWTASEDGTLRQWHIGYRAASEATLPVRSRSSALRCAVTAVVCLEAFLITGSADGGVRTFPLKAYNDRDCLVPTQPTSEHFLRGRISSLAVHPQKLLVAARSFEGEVCVFKITASGKIEVVKTWSGIESSFEEVGVAFAMDSLFTGCRGGLIRINLEEDGDCPLQLLKCKHEVVSVCWNESSAQLALGLSSGEIELHIQESGRGGSRLMSRNKKRVADFSGEADISAGELGMPQSQRRKAEKIRADPVASHRPEPPVYGAGQGGRLGSNVTQQIMRNVLKDTTRDVDPREALLAFAEKAAKNPKWVSNAYAQTQPVPVLDASLLEKERKDEEEKRRRREEMEKLKAERQKRNPNL